MQQFWPLLHLMDAAFQLDDGPRADFLRFIMQSFGCTYICLWSYFPHPSNCLFFKAMDGFFQEENNQPSSSSGSLARRLFDEYRKSVFAVENGRVPGLAFKNSRPYLEIKELDLPRRASFETQRQFYQEARIKTAAFMGCKSGEIEIGLSNVTQINMEMEMRNWFPEDFSRQSPLIEPPQPTDQNRPSSSSSSLRSLSMESPEYSSLLFNIPSTSYINPETLNEAPIEQALMRPISTIASHDPHQQAMQAFTRIRNDQFPTQESEDAAMTRAILAVISCPSSSTSHQPQQNLPYNYRVNQEASAFKNYTIDLAPTTQLKPNLCRQSMLKRAISYFKSINSMRIREQMQGSRPTSTQLHHMISERKRREKLNESFQSLRSLLPPGSKKDKASVLTSTREYLSSLKAQVGDLSRRNQLLEAQLLPAKEANEEASGSSNGRLDVRITQISESTSTSEERIIDMRVNGRSNCSMLDLVIRILEFLKQIKNVSLMSAEAETQLADSSSTNRFVFRLKIEGTEWDESAFGEAVRRVIADLAE